MRYLSTFLFLLLSVSMVACVNTGTSGKTHDASMEWRMKSLEESFLNFREEQKRQAEQLDSLDKKVEQVTAAQQESTEIADGVTITDGAAEAKPEPQTQEGWVTDLKEEDKGWKEVAPEKKPEVAASPEPKPWDEVPQPKPAPPSVDIPRTPQAMYDKGLALYNESRFADSREVFDAYLAKYPKGKLAPNSLYWKGETFYSQKNYPQAILTFKEVVSRYPKHGKAPASMLKIGMSYEMVGDKDNASFYLRTLLEDYPKSAPASIARQRLSALGS